MFIKTSFIVQEMTNGCTSLEDYDPPVSGKVPEVGDFFSYITKVTLRTFLMIQKLLIFKYEIW